MSDFIYSTIKIEEGRLKEEIHSIYSNEKPQVQEYHGKWGSLAVSENLYANFQPLETSKYIFVVIGGPILTYRNNDFLNQRERNLGTKSIFERWSNGKLKWDEDLSGPFAIIIIDKNTSNVEVITDLMSFIPVYIHQNNVKSIISTHVDMLSNIAELKSKIDIASLVDFILHGYITFPYTLYTDIIQINPSTVYYLNGKYLRNKVYWRPIEDYQYKTIKEAANDVTKALKSYTYQVTKNVNDIAQFISGGEDSRVISSLLKEYPRDAFVFLDHFNREAIVAKKIAEIYNANFHISERSKSHYVDILPTCSKLVGTGSQYHHAHTYGFHKSCNLDKYDAVFGGLFSDALLKGARINKHSISNKFPFIGEIKNEKASIEIKDNDLFIKEVIESINTRRKNHYNTIKEMRPESAMEWFELWPSTMNRNIPNLHANRRLFKSYEPFMSNEIVKISACVPQIWKMNRKLFHASSKPFLKESKWILHGDGRLPYFPWTINAFIQFFIKIYRRIATRVGIIKGNQGPWGEWKVIVKSNEWDKMVNGNTVINVDISSAFKDESYMNLLNNEQLPYLNRVNLLQIIFQSNRNK